MHPRAYWVQSISPPNLEPELVRRTCHPDGGFSTMVESCPAEAVHGGCTQIVDPPAQALQARRVDLVPPASERPPVECCPPGAAPVPIAFPPCTSGSPGHRSRSLLEVRLRPLQLAPAGTAGKPRNVGYLRQTSCGHADRPDLGPRPAEPSALVDRDKTARRGFPWPRITECNAACDVAGFRLSTRCDVTAPKRLWRLPSSAAPLKPLPDPVDLEQCLVRRQARVGGPD